MVNRLEQMDFNDTGNLTNAYPFEKIEILALAIYILLFLSAIKRSYCSKRVTSIKALNKNE